MRYSRFPLLLQAGALALVLPLAAKAEQQTTYQIAVADPARPVTRVPVKMKPFPEEIVRSCTIDYGRPVAIVAPVSGRLTMAAETGQQVKRGDVIARYDTEALERRVNEIALDVDYLSARLSYRTGIYQENTNALDVLEEDEKQAARDHLAAQLADMKRLYQQGRLALGRFQEAQRGVDAAEAALERARRQNEMDREEAALEVLRLGNDLEKRRNALEEATDKLNQAVVRASDSGQLMDVETSSAVDGKLTVDEGNRLALLVNPEELGARLQFDTAEMRLVRGSKITVTPQSDGKSRPASISAIHAVEKLGERQRGTYVTEVEVAFSDPDGPKLLNDEAVCRFTKASVKPEPAVPVSSVIIRGDRTFVQKAEGEEAKLIQVELGDIADDYIRVLSGLKSGDFVLD